MLSKNINIIFFFKETSISWNKFTSIFYFVSNIIRKSTARIRYILIFIKNNYFSLFIVSSCFCCCWGSTCYCTYNYNLYFLLLMFLLVHIFSQNTTWPHFFVIIYYFFIFKINVPIVKYKLIIILQTKYLKLL